jgi:hypothetical protein
MTPTGERKRAGGFYHADLERQAPGPGGDKQGLVNDQPLRARDPWLSGAPEDSAAYIPGETSIVPSMMP